MAQSGQYQEMNSDAISAGIVNGKLISQVLLIAQITISKIGRTAADEKVLW